MSNKNSDYYFLQGGGEMGELIRAKDWATTPLGDPSEWPESLRTMVAVMLDNPFGMYIAWGKEYTQIYNDAYRPILGSTKHPQALGISTRDTFPEIWHIIESMFAGVMEGKPVGFPDFMLPLNRNGFVEECYFDFSYSPIRKNDGEVGGVLVTVIETTNKRKAEQNAKESEQRFRNTMKQAPVGITIMRGPDYLVEMANDAYLQLVDRKESEFVGYPLFKSLPEVEEAVHSLLDDVLNTGIPYHGNEVPIPLNRHGKQDVFFFDFLYHPLRDDDGKISGVIAIVTEVTEKVGSKKTIEERKRLYETITQNTPDLIYVFDLNYRFTYANEALLKMWGLSWDNAIGKSMLEIGYEPWHAAMHEREIDQIIATKNPQRGEVSFPHATLGKRIYDYILVPVIDQDGNVEAIAGTTRDTTQHFEARKQIEESEGRFRLLAQALPQLTWVTDANGAQEYASSKWKEYSGIEPAGEEEWKAIVHPDDYDHINAAWLKSLTTGNFYKADVRLLSKNGDYRWHTVNGEPVYDKENKIVKWVGAFTDTHAEKSFSKELESQVSERTKELEASNAELQKMNKELASFAYISSHDLQEPLRKIQTFATLITEKEADHLSENGKHLFLRMQEAAKRMQTLILDLLAYSRTTTQEQKFEKTALSKFIAEVREDFEEQLKQKHGAIESLVSDEIPVIPFQFRQLMYNLMGNSIKFSSADRPLLIQIKSEVADGKTLTNKNLSPHTQYCHITVSDNGIGFEEQYNEKIFEVFQRLHGKNEYEGTGIGLSIVKKIVENHHGYISAHGEPDKGARFEIYIPV